MSTGTPQNVSESQGEALGPVSFWGLETTAGQEIKERDKHQNVRGKQIHGRFVPIKSKSIFRGSFVMVNNKAPVSCIRKSLFRVPQFFYNLDGQTSCELKRQLVLSLGRYSRRKSHLSLGMKQLKERPWEHSLHTMGWDFSAATELSTGRCNWCHHWAFWNLSLRRNLILGI